MGQFLSNKYLKFRSAMQGGLIDVDKKCDQCGYILRGLRYGGACPECGTSIVLRSDPNLAFHEMPLPLIKQFRVNSWIATFSAAGFVGLLVFGRGLVGSAVGLAVPILGLIGVWIYAVWRLTPVLDQPQAAAYGFARGGRLRLAARWLQFGWVLAALSIPSSVLFSRSPFGFGLFTTLFFVGLGLGLLGLVCFVMFLRRFAGWVGDDFAERAFNMAVWGNMIAIPLAVGLANMIFGLGPFLIIVVPLFVVPVAALLIASMLAFPVGLLSLSRSVDWSVVHSRREAERARALREKMAPRPAPLPEPPAQIELAASPEHHSTPVDPVPEKDA
ncbi:MAG: hypothetical protein IIC46_06615 [Planctomycetes bacterium]|nr:hypothetical protein [Planctomycetota bacterium]